MAIEDKEIKNISEEEFQQIVKLVTYVLNNSHYYQKFKIEEGFINPVDILYLL